jgi:TolB-like protein
MTRRDSSGADAGYEASRRYVSVDAGERGAELTEWLGERPEHERALERVELAVVLGRRLAADPTSALHAEAEAARIAPRRRTTTRSLVWGGALAAAVVLVAVLVVPDSVPPAGTPELAPLSAAQRAAVDAPTNAAAVLPTGVVVDAGTVAVLPFAAGDAALAEGLQRDVVEALRTVPGLYVIADAAVSGYASTDLSPSEIGAQLGARGIVDAGIELIDGRVRVNARLRDAATGVTLWWTDVERPVDELRAIRYEIAENVAATMFDPELRERAARPGRSSGPAYSKPLQQ